MGYIAAGVRQFNELGKRGGLGVFQIEFERRFVALMKRHCSCCLSRLDVSRPHVSRLHEAR